MDFDYLETLITEEINSEKSSKSLKKLVNRHKKDTNLMLFHMLEELGEQGVMEGKLINYLIDEIKVIEGMAAAAGIVSILIGLGMTFAIFYSVNAIGVILYLSLGLLSVSLGVYLFKESLKIRALINQFG